MNKELSTIKKQFGDFSPKLVGITDNVLLLWLCSPAASLVIGQAIAVDGGYTIQ